MRVWLPYKFAYVRKSEIKGWCYMNKITFWYSGIWQKPPANLLWLGYRFVNEEDAMAFKLTWLE